MSDTIQPTLQLPTPCDFGPFATGACGRTIEFTMNATEEMVAADVIISVNGGATKTVDLTSYITSSSTVNWNTLTISAPGEGSTITVSGSSITITGGTNLSGDYTLDTPYTVSNVSGQTATGKIILTVIDVTPTLTVKDISFSMIDTETKNVSIVASYIITNDTFASFTVGSVSEGTISASGTTLTYTPDDTIATDRVVTTTYTVTTASGLTSTGNVTINITDDNIWAGSLWYGNSTLAEMDQAGVEALTIVRQQDFPGTYVYPAGDGIYKWIVYPAAWGEPLAIIDPLTGFEVAVNTFQTFTVEGVELLGIRSYYQLNGAYQIKLV